MLTPCIYIKYGSVICDSHWNDVELIRDEEFFRIEAKERYHNSADIHRFMNDYLDFQKKQSLFQPFRDLKFLENE